MVAKPKDSLKDCYANANIDECRVTECVMFV